ncbi:hypothetical protein CC85DRAFT_305741 [Cutaneotrichosporon oleaginosum]|uniref:DASH complex subunit DAD1 n=1 Tax=Cutaneotrichosporon oleaginosum TaxID=879819 RepID=A0A0J0XC86_9TREE|nr:uncharacterized protein CC85DRAFT_305741 [Cutaneotrichosporon oleaginosum]KLT38688.1 hypothetical protein CC85DRAFT_305741 [Cutaneotrichosporon oleaginosum]TXT08269.1 hypothetical protein COLE_05193 [Cutaneotrichosporon oleaginosum]
MAEESYFEREKARLLQEIATGMEDLISTTNAYNRNIEEAYGVGREFKTVADLWGTFVAGATDRNNELHDQGVPGTGGTTFGASTRW